MDRKTIMAFVLIGLVIILMPYYFKMVTPEPPPGTEQPSEQVVTKPGDTQPGSELPVEDTFPGESLSGETLDGEDPSGSVVRDTTERRPAQTVRVETPLYTAIFSSRGATIHSWRVLPTKPYLMETEELVRPEYADRNLTLISRGRLGLLRTSEEVFDVEGGDIRINEGGAPDSLVFTLPLGEDRWYRETFVFYPNRYKVDVHLESRGLGQTTGAISASYGWGGGLANAEIDTAQDYQYTEAAYYTGNDKETFKSNGKKTEEETVTGSTQWVAQRTKYFLMALVPGQPADGVYLYTWPAENYNGKYPPKLFETDLIFNIPEGDLDHQVQLYLGPLEAKHLQRVSDTLDQMISWGWTILQPLSKGIFHVLVFLHNFIPNYGVVLILVALLVKLLVWPLTYKAHTSMKRMQMLQPLLKDVQEKYKDNPQRMQKEVMGLYKEHKVNPMGGCWPTLLQMPLFIALFIVFRSTIELRGQPFMLWINDLSMPDVLFQLPFSIPLYGDHVALLPIVMAATQYLQSRSTVTDPNQKMMTTMMPIMFIFIFNNFPSGLTLYYTLFNLLTWGQQKFMKSHDPELEKLVEERKEEKQKEEEREERRRQKKERS